nr:formate--tetrahydrofolate ligase [Maliibacterium massiliense]
MQTDLDIARAAAIRPITQIAAAAGIDEDALECYGKYKAKVDLTQLDAHPEKADGHLVLVSAINPTAAGEGKTTVSIALADGMRRLGKRAVLALREPSLGPVFGMKGGAAGGGYAQVLPMEDINLHFTGDLHAITAANNLLAAMVDNHIAQGNVLGIDPRQVVWRRCMDMNDRQLRSIVSGMGGKANGMPREDGFDITAASEVMAVLCLAQDFADLKARLARMIVAYTFSGAPVTAGQIGAVGAMAVLLREAIKPNLVQTIEGTPAFVHGGPFANIAHGCNSVIATRMARRLGDYCVTEAGFGADLGAEKFLDIKCRSAQMHPNCVVIVATVRALKFHGGVAKEDLCARNDAALARGIDNLRKHIDNITKVFCLPAVVAINRFADDATEELVAIQQACNGDGVPAVLCEGWAKGGAGAEALAQAVIDQCGLPCDTFQYAYPLNLPLEEKIALLAKRIYGAADVSFSAQARAQLALLVKNGFGDLPVCMAKTQYSLSDNPKLLGRPEGFTLHVRSVRVSAGAGFVVAFSGAIIAMPGLPRHPAAESIDIDAGGQVHGLF